MRKNIIAIFVATRDRKKMAEDMDKAAMELGEFISTFYATDLPVVVFLMQSYCQKILATDDDMPEVVDMLHKMFGSVAVITAVPLKGDAEDEL